MFTQQTNEGGSVFSLPVKDRLYTLNSVMKKFLFLCAMFFAMTFSAQAKSLESLHADGLNKLIEQHHGKVIMLNFFATWCPPCREEIPELVKASAKYKGKDVLIVSLSVDESKSKATVEKFVDKMKIDYPVYMAGRDLIQRYEVGSIPHNVFYDRQGNIVISQPGQCDADDVSLVVEELLHAK